MNVLWYTGRFDGACWQLLAMLGLHPSRFAQEETGMAAVEHHTQGKGELHAATELFASLSAPLARLVFSEIGFLPLRKQQMETVPLTRECRTLRSVRTVQFVENNEQRHTARVLPDKRIRP